KRVRSSHPKSKAVARTGLTRTRPRYWFEAGWKPFRRSSKPLRRHQPLQRSVAFAHVIACDIRYAGLGQVDVRLAVADQPTEELREIWHVADQAERIGAGAAQKPCDFLGPDPGGQFLAFLNSRR